ncbi:succinate dehydrogenase subunit 5, mitochondrial [Pyrus x bretschneideri]|uniref:succinate dehydrogenase subunit 5, mitochondrial n=1 Tax=Pyrus x bretschneideri TaxID=225117 RepID=UPI0005118892|nr:succinate dehydrogenase subunit 5, mitochondrial [Pyrus x bretschneideri]
MAKMIALRSLYRSVSSRSYRVAAANQQLLRHSQLLHSSAAAARTLFNASSPVAKDLSSDDYKSPFSRGLGSRKFYSDDVSHLPAIKDPALLNVFKDLLAASWDELPNSVVHEAKAALSQNTDDQTGKEVVTNVFRAAEAVEEFGGMITNLKMELDDSVGMSGENVKPLSDEYVNALKTIFSRYITYLDAFGPEETYLRKKVETELGTKLIYLKMRCSGFGSEWGKISVLGTSGLSGSYIEQRA